MSAFQEFTTLFFAITGAIIVGLGSLAVALRIYFKVSWYFKNFTCSIDLLRICRELRDDGIIDNQIEITPKAKEIMKRIRKEQVDSLKMGNTQEL